MLTAALPPLPLDYTPDIGGFVRLGANANESVFQGIRLDIHFRLPLDDVFKYKEMLNKMKFRSFQLKKRSIP
jgi:hypothetical protein